MPVLVYWYGSTIPVVSHCLVPYSNIQECLVRENRVMLPWSIQRKVSYYGRTDVLTWREQAIYRAYWELNEDLARGSVRRGEPFREFYEEDNNYVLSVLASKSCTQDTTSRGNQTRSRPEDARSEDSSLNENTRTNKRARHNEDQADFKTRALSRITKFFSLGWLTGNGSGYDMGGGRVDNEKGDRECGEGHQPKSTRAKRKRAESEE